MTTLTAATTSHSFNVGQIVKGARCGTFVILGFRDASGETCAQVKPVNPATGEIGRGEMALPVSKLRA
jgi:hypothetical protein